MLSCTCPNYFVIFWLSKDLQARPVFSVQFDLAAFVSVSSFAIGPYFSNSPDSPQTCFVVLTNFGYRCYNSYRLDRVRIMSTFKSSVQTPWMLCPAMPCTKKENEALARWQFCCSQWLSCTFCALCISSKAGIWCEMMIRYHTVLQHWFTTLQVEPQEFQNMSNLVEGCWGMLRDVEGCWGMFEVNAARTKKGERRFATF